MLLFSTVLDIKESITQDDFINLVIEWNNENPRAENRVPGVCWKGERNIRYGDNDKLWLAIEEYRNKNIIAVRHEKVEKDGVIWDLDYVMNFDEMKLAIQLERSYARGASVTDYAFSTPHIITLLIEKGYLKEDGKLPVLREPVYITEENIEMLTNVINGTSKYRLPVVYVSKTRDGNAPIDIKKLVSNLKGVAHVLVQDDKQMENALKAVCPDDKCEYNGSITVYYPGEAMESREFFYWEKEGFDEALLKKVAGNVIQYVSSQSIDNLYTWQGVAHALLIDRLASKKEEKDASDSDHQKVRDEIKKAKEEFGLDQLQQQVQELIQENERLKKDKDLLQGEQAKRGAGVPVICMRNEIDYGDGEVKRIVLSTLKKALDNMDKDKMTRRVDVLSDIVEHNSQSA